MCRRPSMRPADICPPICPATRRYRKINPADAPVMILIMTSDAMTQDQMYDAADSIMGQKLAQVEGVGQVFVWGSSQPAVRIEANPNLLNKLNIGLEAVRSAVASQNANMAKGSLDERQQDLDDPGQRSAQEGSGLQAHHRRLPKRRSGPAERRSRRSGFLLQHQQRGQLQRQAQRAGGHLPPAGRQHDRHRRPH